MEGRRGPPPRASPDPLLPLQLTIQQNPKDGLEVLTCHLPQCKGLSRRLGEQAQEEDDCVLWGQGGQVDVAVGNRRGTAGPRGGWTLETESRVLGAGLESVSSGTSPPGLSRLKGSSSETPMMAPQGQEAIPWHVLLLFP